MARRAGAAPTSSCSAPTTAPAAGHVAPGRSAQTLLEGGPAALAIAPADYRAAATREIRPIGIARRARRRRRDRDRPSRWPTRSTRRVLARAARRPAGRRLPARGARGPRDDQRRARRTRSRTATCPVIVAARGVPLHFETLVTGLSGRARAARVRLSCRGPCGRWSSPISISAPRLATTCCAAPAPLARAARCA